ncbi:MAG: multiheme c-type cytochrome [Kofleriaceae bacterium]
MRHHPNRALLGATFALGLVAATGCGEDAKLTVEQLQDPSTCMDCHPKHYQQWSGSMHAYAADDPVFVAMNNRGQRETNGRLGNFCINCHAPMAERLGFTDFANFDPAALPPSARGITCYFCHNVTEVTTTHNNGLVLANDQTMRGGVKNPVDSSAHHSKYDVLMDSDLNQSELCGSCHDIVVPGALNGRHDVAVERTFAEWKTTIFATETAPGIHLTCGGCHMGSSDDVVADAPGLDVPLRNGGFHSHMFPGIDLAMTPFPEQAAQRAAVQEILDQSVNIIGPTPRVPGEPPPGGICVEPVDGGRITVRIDSFGTGHSWPSGAAMDRRAWLELIAYDESGAVVYQRGVVPDGVDPEIADPQVFGFWDRTFKADDTPAHFFWEIDRIDSKLLKGPTTLVQTDPAFDHSVTQAFVVGADVARIQRITARMRFRALPFEVLDSLIASGDLAPEIRDQVPTLEVGQPKVWLRSTARLGCGPP